MCTCAVDLGLLSVQWSRPLGGHEDICLPGDEGLPLERTVEDTHTKVSEIVVVVVVVTVQFSYLSL